MSLLESEIPAHSHALMAQGAPADTNLPGGNAIARVIGATPYLPPAGAPLTMMSPEALAPAGGDAPHNNLQPYLTFYFNIALQGVFPPRG